MREWLIRLRGQRPQSEVANEVGISQQAYSMIERGLRCPSVPLAKRIATTLNFEWQRFYEADEEFMLQIGRKSTNQDKSA